MPTYLFFFLLKTLKKVSRSAAMPDFLSVPKRKNDGAFWLNLFNSHS